MIENAALSSSVAADHKSAARWPGNLAGDCGRADPTPPFGGDPTPRNRRNAKPTPGLLVRIGPIEKKSALNQIADNKGVGRGCGPQQPKNGARV